PRGDFVQEDCDSAVDQTRAALGQEVKPEHTSRITLFHRARSKALDTEPIGGNALVQQVCPCGNSCQADKAPGQVWERGGIRDQARQEIEEENPGEDEVLAVDKVGPAVII